MADPFIECVKCSRLLPSGEFPGGYFGKVGVCEECLALDEERRVMSDQPSDLDPNNPVDLTADEWRDIYSDPDFEDNEP